MKSVTFYIISIFLFSTRVSFTQPQIDLMQTYDDGEQEGFYDIFLTADGGFVACGKIAEEWAAEHQTADFWVTRIDAQGNQIWSNSYPPREVWDDANSIIETDDGNFLIGGHNNVQFAALLVDDEGEPIWSNTYVEGICRAVIELKSGEFLLAGTRVLDSYLLCLDGDGDVIWQRAYEHGSRSKFYTMRETEGGIIVAGHTVIEREHNVLVKKVDFDGEPIWTRIHGNDGEGWVCTIMDSRPDGGFISGGTRTIYEDRDTDIMVMMIDDEGRQEGIETFEWDDVEDANEACFGLTKLDNGGFALVGLRSTRETHPFVIVLNSNGVERWRRLYSFIDNDGNHQPSSFYSVVATEDRSIIAAGSIENRRMITGWDGLLVRLEQDVPEPVIFYHLPEDTILSVLPSDTVQFVARARNQLGDEMNYLWLVEGIEDEDTLGRDTTVTVQFDSLSVYEVQFQVSEGDYMVSITWHITGEEWYIDRHTPDSLSWTIRRPREVDFELGVRAIEGVEPQFRWILTGHRGAWEDVGDAPNLTYEFDRPGEYSLEGRAFHDGTVHSVTWQIAVRSVLYWWTPHERELTIDLHDEIEFNLIPFNPNSDSLDFQWFIDGEHDENELDAGIFYSFGDLGDHSVTAIVHDGAEVDTVIWSIAVEDPNDVEDGIDGLLPTEVTLYPAAPNPFNSRTRVRYFLPITADVRLTVYDSAGRLVQTLHDDMTVAGEHRATLHGAELPTGVYLLKLEAADVVRSMKVVLLK